MLYEKVDRRIKSSLFFDKINERQKAEGGDTQMSLRNLIVALLFTMTSLFTIHNTASAATSFSDVSKSDYYYNQVQYLVGQNIINGYEEKGRTSFKPNQAVTRAEVAKMVVTAKKQTGLKVTSYHFKDVSSKDWFGKYVYQAVQLGYMDGYGGSTTEFKPYEKVSRQEMSKILSIAFNLNPDAYEKYALPFNDVERNLYYNYIAAVYYNGLGAGVSNTKFDPRSNVTRATFSVFMSRGLNKSFQLALPVQKEQVSASANVKGQVRVNTNGLNVRSTPNFTSTANNKLGTLSTGTVVKYYEETSSYYKINYNGYYGYIYKTYASLVTDANLGGNGSTPEPTPTPTPQQPPTTASGLIGYATVNGLNIRAQASASADRVGGLSRGNQVTVHSISGNWAHISFNGQSGYVSKTYLRLKNTSGPAVKGRVIVLDPGHGGRDPGAVAKDASAMEKAIVLNVAQKVKTFLEIDGAIVKMTRSGDTFPTLQERVGFAKNNYGELFVSIHVNSATSTSANGTETFYSISGNDNELEDAKLARYINNEIVSNANMRDRGVKREDYYVIRNLIMPAVLVELGFISNSSDLAKLKDSAYIDIYARSIYRGIVQYYND